VLQELAEKNARVLERELEVAVGMIVQLQGNASKVCVFDDLHYCDVINACAHAQYAVISA
jgi:hypothetical protein